MIYYGHKPNFKGEIIMKSTLPIIQTLAKIGKILSGIASVFCVVGAVLCLIALAEAAFFPNGMLKIGNTTIYGLIPVGSNLSHAQLSGYILLIGEAVIAKFAQLYFKRELTDGTPFTFKGAKELLRLGIITVSVSAASFIAESVIYLFTGRFDGICGSVSLGIAFIIVSLIFRHGAEQNQSEREDF